MKYILSSISFLIVVFFDNIDRDLNRLFTSSGVGDTVRDTVSLEKLSVPTIDSVEVLAGGESQRSIFRQFCGKEKFCGFYLLAIMLKAPLSLLKIRLLLQGLDRQNPLLFHIRDGIQTFWIASYNKS